MSIFTFDPQSHSYFLDGVQIPGVTRVLREAGLVPNYGGFSGPQYRGLHVHTACEYLDLNDLDWSSVHPDYIGYVRAWDRFKKESGFNPTLIEYQSWHKLYRYGGTLDRRGSLNGSHFILEIKTGYPAAWHALQLSGYKMFGGDDWVLDRRGAVYLKEDGSYSLKEFNDPSDDGVFLSALALNNWRGIHA